MTPEDLLKKVKDRKFSVGIMGLGRVGLPLGLAFACQGINVVGIDRDDRLLSLVEGGTMPFEEIGGQEALNEALAAKRLSVTSDYAYLNNVDVLFITVATGLNNEQRVDYAQVESALAALTPHLRPVQLLKQRVKQHDFTKSADAGKKRVGVSRPFAAVHDLNVLRPKTGPFGQRQKTLAQTSFRQRRELIEQRQN